MEGGQEYHLHPETKDTETAEDTGSESPLWSPSHPPAENPGASCSCCGLSSPAAVVLICRHKAFGFSVSWHLLKKKERLEEKLLDLNIRAERNRVRGNCGELAERGLCVALKWCCEAFLPFLLSFKTLHKG